MGFDLETISRRLAEAHVTLAQARADVEFLENAKRVLADPRAARLLEPDGGMQRRSYGELKQNVYQSLPLAGEPPFTSGMIVEYLTVAGYSFTAAHPVNAVNEALRSLEAEGKAVVMGRSGIAKLWARASDTTAAELAAYESDSRDVPVSDDVPDDILDWLENKDA